MNGDIAVFAGNSNKQIAEEICTHLGIQSGKINLKKFSDGEISVKIEDNVRRKSKFLSFNPLRPQLTII